MRSNCDEVTTDSVTDSSHPTNSNEMVPNATEHQTLATAGIHPPSYNSIQRTPGGYPKQTYVPYPTVPGNAPYAANPTYPVPANAPYAEAPLYPSLANASHGFIQTDLPSTSAVAATHASTPNVFQDIAGANPSVKSNDGDASTCKIEMDAKDTEKHQPKDI